MHTFTIPWSVSREQHTRVGITEIHHPLHNEYKQHTTGHMTQSRRTATQGMKHIKQRKTTNTHRGKTQVTPWLPIGYWLGDDPSSHRRQRTPLSYPGRWRISTERRAYRTRSYGAYLHPRSITSRQHEHKVRVTTVLYSPRSPRSNHPTEVRILPVCVLHSIHAWYATRLLINWYHNCL